jgi:hypothetical protein
MSPPNLFGLDIAGIVESAISAAGGLLPATLIVVTPGTRTPGSVSAGTNPTSTDYACKGLVSDYAVGQIDNTLVQQGDRKVLLIARSIGGGAVEPKPSDRVTIESRTYTVIAVTRDAAAAAYHLQVRG